MGSQCKAGQTAGQAGVPEQSGPGGMCSRVRQLGQVRVVARQSVDICCVCRCWRVMLPDVAGTCGCPFPLYTRTGAGRT